METLLMEIRVLQNKASKFTEFFKNILCALWLNIFP